jgi:hypothetical protein
MLSRAKYMHIVSLLSQFAAAGASPVRCGVVRRPQNPSTKQVFSHQYYSECGFRFGTRYFVFNSSHSVLLQHSRSHNTINFPHLGNKPLSKMPGDKNELKIFLTYCANMVSMHGWFVIPFCSSSAAEIREIDESKRTR